jgi:CHAD domain-containing protein
MTESQLKPQPSPQSSDNSSSKPAVTKAPNLEASKPEVSKPEASKPEHSKSSDSAPVTEPAAEQKLGDFAHSIIDEQFHALAKQKRNVLADEDSEHLHKMRVATRRLQSALQTFSSTIQLPKAAQIKQVRALGKALGKLRDLDVQTTAIQTQYYPLLNASEQEVLRGLLKRLQKDRQEAYEEVEVMLTCSRYKKLKAAFSDWLKEPQYEAIAQIPLTIAIPDLIHPLLSTLLLHPAWLISFQATDQSSNTTLHDLRKVCKAVRYQAEFFESFYGSNFHSWIGELKILQENLGKVQDSSVLLKMLQSQKADLPELESLMGQQQLQAMANWEPIRQRYLSREFRQSLYQTIATGLPTPQKPSN